MSDPTPPPPTPDPTASAREWAALPEKWRGIIDSRIASIVRDLSAFARTCTAVDDGFAKELDAFNAARRVLADAPALLARLEEAEGLLREVSSSAREKIETWGNDRVAVEQAAARPEGWSDDFVRLAVALTRVDAFLAPSTPRVEGPSRG